MSCLTLPLDEPLDPPLTPPERDTKMGRQMIPCVEAIMINPVISRRGYLLVLEQDWLKTLLTLRVSYIHSVPCQFLPFLTTLSRIFSILGKI